jgi:hypothetical protein
MERLVRSGVALPKFNVARSAQKKQTMALK